jgi:hypothetical protein
MTLFKTPQTHRKHMGNFFFAQANSGHFRPIGPNGIPVDFPKDTIRQTWPYSKHTQTHRKHMGNFFFAQANSGHFRPVGPWWDALWISHRTLYDKHDPSHNNPKTSKLAGKTDFVPSKFGSYRPIGFLYKTLRTSRPKLPPNSRNFSKKKYPTFYLRPIQPYVKSLEFHLYQVLFQFRFH